MARKNQGKGGKDGACRCGHMKSLHLPRWRDESVANKCERCPDSEPCPGYVPSAPGEQTAPQPPKHREKKRSPTRERREAPRNPSPAVRPERKSRPAGRSTRRTRRGR